MAWRENGEDERTTYTLDPIGRVIETENADATSNSATFDDAGRQLTRIDENGQDTELSYDAEGRVLSELRADGGTWEYTYDANGNRLTEENPSGDVVTHIYDANNRLLSTEDAEGGITSYEYDEAGNLTLMTNPLGKETSYEYDDAGQRTKMIDPNLVETTYTYTVRGQLDTETTGSKVVEYTYDGRGNILTVEQGSSLTTYTYDAANNVLTHTMPDGSTLTNVYDDVNRRTSEVHSIRGTTTWTYDGAGRVLTEVSGAGTTTYTYNTAGRVSQIDYPGSMTVSFVYDDAGRLESVTDWKGTRTFGRDEVGRVESFTSAQGKAGTYTYDTSGRKTAATWKKYNNTVVNQSWTYDDAGRVLTFVSGLGTITYTYTDTGQLATRTYPNSKVETRTYDDTGRMKTQQVTGGPLVTYTYDSNDRVIKVEHTVSSVTTTKDRYTYDSSGRLETWWRNSDYGRTDYTYTTGGDLATIKRQVLNPPSGTNTTAQDNAIAACITTPGSCISQWSTELGAWTPNVPSATNPATTTGNRAAVARWMNTHPVTIRTYTHNSAGQLTQIKNGWAQSISHYLAYGTRGNQTAFGGTPTNNSTDYHHDDHVKTMVAGTETATYTYTHDGLLTNVDNAGTLLEDTSHDYDDQGRVLWARKKAPNLNATDFMYVWDAYGIVAFSVNGGSSFTYFPVYNPRGDAVSYHQTGVSTFDNAEYTPWGEYTMSSPLPFGPASVFNRAGILVVMRGRRGHEQREEALARADHREAQDG